MAINNYITTSNTVLAEQDFTTDVRAVVASGVSAVAVDVASTTIVSSGGSSSTVVVPNGVAFMSPGMATPRGGLRWYNSRLEYTDDNQIWKPLAGATSEWYPGNSYPQGAVVMYNRSWWYAAQAVPAGTQPGLSASWVLMTIGSYVQYVTNTQELQRAFSQVATNLTIVMSGTFSGNDQTGIISVTGTATNITIYSDENSSIAGSLEISVPSATSIYWHTNGTRIQVAAHISMPQGTLWIERLVCAVSNANIYLYSTGQTPATTTIRYQRIDATVVGGTKVTWAGVDYMNEGVPRILGTLSSQSIFTSDAKFYVDQNTSSGSALAYTGYTTWGTLVDMTAASAAPQAITYMKIDEQGLYANLPDAATKPFGYVYYATDTGDLYVNERPNKTWSTPIPFRGEKGDRGSDGPRGPQGSAGVTPTFGIYNVSTGRPGTSAAVELMSNGSAYQFKFTIPEGSAAVPNTLTIGDVSGGSVASASISGTTPNYRLNLVLPTGPQGSTGPANSLGLGPTATLDPSSSAYVQITGTPPAQTLTFGIPRGSQGVAGSKGDTGDTGAPGWTAIPTMDNSGTLSWVSSQLSDPPTLPTSRNLTGPAGASTYDTWKEIYGTPTSTPADFMDAVGAGSRFMPFTAASVSSKNVTFNTKYPAISLMTNTGVVWPIPVDKITYNRTLGVAVLNIDWVLEAMDLVSRDARITVLPGVFTYDPNGEQTIDNVTWHCWVDPEQGSIYTNTLTIVEDSTMAYAVPGDANSWSGVITGYSAGHADIPISGTWYVTFGGGGGNAEYITPIEQINGAAPEIAPGVVGQWTLSTDSTLSASTLPAGYVGTSLLYIISNGYSVTAGTNISFGDTLEANDVNVCKIMWFNGAARLKVLDSFNVV